MCEGQGSVVRLREAETRPKAASCVENFPILLLYLLQTFDISLAIRLEKSDYQQINWLLSGYIGSLLRFWRGACRIS